MSETAYTLVLTERELLALWQTANGFSALSDPRRSALDKLNALASGVFSDDAIRRPRAGR